MHAIQSLHQLATSLRLPATWLKREALAGRLPCLRVGRSMRFNVASVEQALAQRAATERILSAHQVPSEPVLSD
jgi:hypothetical protein